MDKKAFYKIGYGLYVLTTNDGKKDNGMVNNTFMQITSDPFEVVVAVNKANYSHGVIADTRKFNLSVLSEDVTFDVIKRFGFQSGRDADKFAGFESCFKMPNGIYALNNRYANAFFVCVRFLSEERKTQAAGDGRENRLAVHGVRLRIRGGNPSRRFYMPDLQAPRKRF